MAIFSHQFIISDGPNHTLADFYKFSPLSCKSKRYLFMSKNLQKSHELDYSQKIALKQTKTVFLPTQSPWPSFPCVGTFPIFESSVPLFIIAFMMCQYNNIVNASLNSQPAMLLSPHSADHLSNLPAFLACEGRPQGTCLLCADQ